MEIIKVKVDQAIYKMDSLKKIVEECCVQQSKSNSVEISLSDYVDAESQMGYGAKSFEKY